MKRRLGVALASAMVLAVILLGLVTVMVSETRLAGRQQLASAARQRSYYAARAALNLGMARLNQSSGFLAQHDSAARALVQDGLKVWAEVRPPVVILHGRGEVDGVVYELKRAVKQEDPDPLPLVFASVGSGWVGGDFSLYVRNPTTDQWTAGPVVPNTGGADRIVAEVGVTDDNVPYQLVFHYVPGTLNRTGVSVALPGQALTPLVAPFPATRYRTAGNYVLAAGTDRAAYYQVSTGTWTELPGRTGLTELCGRDEQGGVYAQVNWTESVNMGFFSMPVPRSGYAYLAPGASTWTDLPRPPWQPTDPWQSMMSTGSTSPAIVTTTGKLVVASGTGLYEGTPGNWSRTADITPGIANRLSPDQTGGFVHIDNFLNIATARLTHFDRRRRATPLASLSGASAPDAPLGGNIGNRAYLGIGSQEEAVQESTAQKRYTADWEFP